MAVVSNWRAWWLGAALCLLWPAWLAAQSVGHPVWLAGSVSLDDCAKFDANGDLLSAGPCGSAAESFEKTFSAVTSLTILGTEHNIGHAKITWACYDNSTPKRWIQPESVTVDTASFDVVFTFALSSTGSCVVAGAGGSDSAHAILSGRHNDTTSATVARGDLMIGNATPAWDRVPLGTVGQYLRSDGSDALWSAILEGDIPAAIARDNESPAAGDISGSLSAGYQIGSGAVGTAEVAATLKSVTKTVTVLDPVTGDTNKAHIYWPSEVTLDRIACSTAPTAATVSINFDERAEATPNTAGTNTLSADLVCDDNTEFTTSFADAVIAGDVPHNLQITATSGTPTVVRIHVRATIN